jgi:hypothetical protein
MTAGVGPDGLCVTFFFFFPQGGELDEATEECVRVLRLVRAATVGEVLSTAAGLTPEVGVELSVTDGDGDTPPDESVGDAAGLEPWICPGCVELAGAAPEDLAGLQLEDALGPVEPREPTVEWLCALVPPPLRWEPLALLPPTPVDRGAFDALGEIPC